MSAPSAPSSARRAEVRRDALPAEGSGWVTFAGIVLVILGVMNVIYGIGAIDDANVYVANANFVFSNLNTWGWCLLVVGVVQVFGAFSIWNRHELGRWIGIASAAVNAILQLLWMPAFPFLAASLFALDILVIYGLIVYGGRRTA